MVPRIACARAAIVSILLASGCQDLGTLVQPAPHAALSSTALDFGTIALHQSATRSLTITNDGTGTLTGAPALSGAGYAFASGGGEFRLDPNQSATIVVSFSPDAEATFPGTLELGASAPTVSLTGIGGTQASGAACLVVPATLDFGSVTAGHPKTASFDVYSVGSAALSINVVSNLTPVSASSGGGPGTLAPGTSRHVDLLFDPHTGGRTQGTVSVGLGCTEVSVVGVGVTVSYANDVRPILTACQNCHSFGSPTDGYDHLVNVPSSYFPGRTIVIPFDPDHSTLYTMMSWLGPGQPMPQGGTMLPQRQRDTVRSWILEGATNN